MSPRFEALIPDANGILRGLSAPMAEGRRLAEDGMSWSSSLFSSRFDGAVVEESGYGLAAGDPDFGLRAVPGTDAPVPWHGQGGGRQALFCMYRPDGEAFALDPQHALAAILQKMQKDGLNGILATEFEFYLTRQETGAPDGEEGFADLYSLDEIHRQSGFFARVADYAKVQRVGVGNVIAEYGAGQWEVNLHHTHAMRAVLEGVLLRRIVRAAARQCNQNATFMAKPFAGSGGSGMHIHISVWKDGENVFADETILLRAVAGVLAIVREAMVFFAPFDNSYRRLLPGSYAPCDVSWGRENRSVAVRLPRAESDGERRLEFRLCGADVNPILAAAALLAGIHHGLTGELTPPPPREAEAGGEDETVPLTWRAAIDEFAAARILPRYFSEAFLANYLCIKENEWRHHRAYISDYDTRYVGRVV